MFFCWFVCLFYVFGFHLYNCIVIQIAFVFKRTAIFSLVTLYSSFFLSFVRTDFVEEFQLASVNIDTILCIVLVFPRPFSAGQPV